MWLKVSSLLVIGVALGFWWYQKEHWPDPVSSEVKQEELVIPQQEAVQPEQTIPPQAPLVTEVTPPRDSLETPFILQAPQGEWSNPLFENACEEASMLMVAHLLMDTEKKEALDTKGELLKLIAYEQKVFGHAFDTSAIDTGKVLRDYFSLENEVREVAQEKDMRELLVHNILILPTNGQKLGNPFFKAPGPETHMLVVLKYDTKTGEYIVHDPGTKRGAFYRYQASVLWNALEDYPTGAKHLPKTKKEKRVIVVSLEKQKATP